MWALHFSLSHTGLLGEIARRGGWVGLEHPADRGREPFPSFFATAVVRDFCAYFRLFYTHLDQCMYGAVSRKPTGILQPHGCRSLAAVCNHDGSHEQLLGLDKDGRFGQLQQRNTLVAYVLHLLIALFNGWSERTCIIILNRLHPKVQAIPFQTHGFCVQWKL